MKKIEKIILTTILLIAVYCHLPTAMAQGPGFDEDVEDTPIDGGVTLIAAAAVGYGVKKLHEKRKNNRAK